MRGKTKIVLLFHGPAKISKLIFIKTELMIKNKILMLVNLFMTFIFLIHLLTLVFCLTV